MKEKLQRISNMLLSLCAGFASFAFTLVAVLMMRDLDEQIAASLTMGLFALLIVWVAAERPNSAHARAVAALSDRLLAVDAGDLTSARKSTRLNSSHQCAARMPSSDCKIKNQNQVDTLHDTYNS